MMLMMMMIIIIILIVLLNQGIQTDRKVLPNRPDIIVKNKKDKTCLLIDVAIPSDKNIIQKEAEKKLKYKHLSTSCLKKSFTTSKGYRNSEMWNMKWIAGSEPAGRMLPAILL
jgi:hypothetical protein